MKQPGLDGRHRNKDGTILAKRGDTFNENLSTPIPEFGDKVSLQKMREVTGKLSEKEVLAAAKKLYPKHK